MCAPLVYESCIDPKLYAVLRAARTVVMVTPPCLRPLLASSAQPVSISPSPVSQTNDGSDCHAAADVTGYRDNQRSTVTLSRKEGCSGAAVGADVRLA